MLRSARKLFLCRFITFHCFVLLRTAFEFIVCSSVLCGGGVGTWRGSNSCYDPSRRTATLNGKRFLQHSASVGPCEAVVAAGPVEGSPRSFALVLDGKLAAMALPLMMRVDRTTSRGVLICTPVQGALPH